MDKVWLVEWRSAEDACVMFAASTKAGALAYCAANPDDSNRKVPWWWVVSALPIDRDPFAPADTYWNDDLTFVSWDGIVLEKAPTEGYPHGILTAQQSQ